MLRLHKSEFKHALVSGLKNNPHDIYALLSEKIESESDRIILSSNLSNITSYLQEIENLKKERNKLSRQIGTAKKNNKNCSDLIKSVASKSKCIDNLHLQVNDFVSSIHFLLPEAQSQSEIDQENIPLHFIRYQSSHLDSGQRTSDNLVLNHSQVVDDSEWNSFVRKSSQGTIYHDSCWGQVIKDNFSQRIINITCRNRTGDLVGVFPTIHMKSMTFGSFIVSLPYFNYGGPLGENTRIEETMISYAEQLADQLGCTHMEVRDTKPRPKWQSVQRKVSMVLPLPNSDKILDSQLGSKIRSQVKKAKANRLVVKFGGLEIVNDFYHVFSVNMRDLGTPVYSANFFVDILKNFPETAFISVVYKNEKPVAAGFLLGYKDKLEIPWASSLKKYNHLGGNMLLYRSILTEAISREFEYFDFGRSTENGSTYKFKKQWGATSHQLHWHYWTKDNHQVPSLNPDNAKFRLVIRAWKLLPVFVSRLIGPFLSRNLP